MIPPELERHATQLRDLGYNVELVEEGPRIYIMFRDYPAGPAYSPSRIPELMVYTSNLYPQAGFDMFWTTQWIKVNASNGMPKNADQPEPYLGRSWQRWSWHLNRNWDPSRDSLLTWMSTVDQRLAQGV